MIAVQNIRPRAAKKLATMRVDRVSLLKRRARKLPPASPAMNKETIKLSAVTEEPHN